MAEVVEAMHRELEQRKGYISDQKVNTIYFGGGTPSLLQPAQLQQFIDQARSLFDTSGLGEITVEANPDDLTDGYIRELRLTDVNRLSIGIQSFDDECLRMMRRRHTAQEAFDAVRRVQDAGFERITIDLMFGIEGFGRASLEGSLQRAIELDVGHVSAYHLTIEPQTLFGLKVRQGAMREVDEATSEEEYMLVHDRLTAAGYEHYEISNYARQGERACHNSSYWNSTQYLGIGAGAHSFNGVSRHWAASRIGDYLAGVGSEDEYLSPIDRRNEVIMTALRTADGLNLSLFEQMFGTRSLDELRAMAQEYAERGLIIYDGEKMKIPFEKFLLSDSIIGALFVDNGLR